MSDHVLKTIEQIQQDIAKVEDTLRPKKLLVNQLCEMVGIQPAYQLGDESSPRASSTIRRNAFYGKPLSTSVREFLEMRSNLPVREATLDEIFAALREGGFDLKQISDKEDDQKRGVAITLGKNSQTFHRLPTGDYGLLIWYPGIKEKKVKPVNGKDEAKADQPNDGEPQKSEYPQESKSAEVSDHSGA